MYIISCPELAWFCSHHVDIAPNGIFQGRQLSFGGYWPWAVCVVLCLWIAHGGCNGCFEKIIFFGIERHCTVLPSIFWFVLLQLRMAPVASLEVEWPLLSCCSSWWLWRHTLCSAVSRSVVPRGQGRLWRHSFVLKDHSSPSLFICKPDGIELSVHRANVLARADCFRNPLAV